jgi:phycocyanobilin lyase alpha subunit
MRKTEPDYRDNSEGKAINEQEAIRRMQLSDDPSAQYYAAWWLGRNRSQNPEAIQLLRHALHQRRPKDLSAEVEENAVARNAARALGKLGQVAKESIPDLVEILHDDDYGLREAASRSLGQLQATAAIIPILQRLSSGPGIAGAREPGTPRLREPCDAMLEALGDIGQASTDVISIIKLYVNHERTVVHSSACRALLQLTGDANWGEELVRLLKHDQLQVRRAALMDLGATGWRQALEAISETLAENSLKLIAIKGLSEKSKSEEIDIPLLDAMDSLL